MAKAEQEISVKAVLAYARELRERASRARVKDPYANPFKITDDAARKISQQLGPQAALTEIARRATAHDMRVREEAARSAQAETNHLVNQLTARGERDAARAVLTLGQRLDIALRQVGMLSEAPAARLDGDRVTGSRSPGLVFSGRRRLEREVLLADVEGLVGRAERLAESTRRRMVEEAA